MKNGKLKLSLLITLAALILLLLIPLSAHAEGEALLSGSCGDNVYYVLDSEGTLTVSGTGQMTDYSVSDPSPWYNQWKTIKKAVIKEGVTRVGNYAFRMCSQLEEVDFSSTIESIGAYSFYSCSKLENVVFPEGLKKIEQSAFESCSMIGSITIPGGVTRVPSRGFAYCSLLSDVTLCDGVEKISDRAFMSCPALSTFRMPSSVKSFGMDAIDLGKIKTLYFNDIVKWCSIDFSVSRSNPMTGAQTVYLDGKLLENLVIPEGVESISDAAFTGARCLKSVTLPSSLKTVGLNAFLSCDNIDTIYINDMTTWCGIDFANNGSNPLEYAEHIVVNGKETTQMVIPEGIEEIKNFAFEGSSIITSVSVPNSVKKISDCAFTGCNDITDIYFGGTAAEWGHIQRSYIHSEILCIVPIHCADITMDNILGACGDDIAWGFKNNVLTIHGSGPMNINSVPWSNYSGSIYSVNISDGVTSIANSAFNKCKKLKSITLPEGIESIGGLAFKDCISLTSVTLPSSVVSIGNFSFENCTSLSKITAQGLKTVGKYAFYGCGVLNYIKLSADISDIGENAFPANDNLVDVYYGGTYKQWSVLSVAQGNEGLLKACIHSSDAANSKAVPLRTISLGNNRIALDWDESEGSEFFVYRSESKNGPFTLIGNDPNSNIYKYVDKTAEHGKTYYYRVVNYDVIGSRLVYFSSKTVGGRTDVTKPKLTVSRDGFTSLKLTWKAVDGAAGYKVYRYSSGTYKLIATVKGKTSYIDGSLKPSASYSYRIKAYSVKDGVTAYSDFSVNNGEVVIAAAPQAFKPVSAGYTSIKLTWNKVLGASGYEILRSTSKTGTFSKIKTVTSGSTLSYIDTSLSCATTYYYKIRAYRTASGKKNYGDYSSIASAKPVPAKTSVSLKKASSSSIKVSWSKVSGASGYEVYRSTSKTGSYSKVKTVTSGVTISYTNTSLSKGKTYYYKVRAYRTVYGKKVYGAFSTVKSLKLS